MPEIRYYNVVQTRTVRVRAGNIEEAARAAAEAFGTSTGAEKYLVQQNYKIRDIRMEIEEDR